jgi:hypothetical protein
MRHSERVSAEKSQEQTHQKQNSHDIQDELEQQVEPSDKETMPPAKEDLE